MNTRGEGSGSKTAGESRFLALAGGRKLPLSGCLLMGVLNVTPDSFSDGGCYYAKERAVEHGLRLAEEGAELIDVGGESTRPGADPVPAGEQIARVVPVIEELARRGKAAISVDTSRAEVARAALEAGATMVNDVTALRGDARMAEVVAEWGAGCVLMHMRGTPRTMQRNPCYRNVVEEVAGFLRRRAAWAVSRGIARESLVLDPGLGFGKTLEHNLRLIAHLARLRQEGYPLLLGASRKSFLGKLLGEAAVDSREEGTLAISVLAVASGVSLLRVHEVAANRRAVRVAEAVGRARARQSVVEA